jgi:flavin reductase (DIM6/NTAB) family NADH-FMN oxidoreductase RutF
MELIPADAPPGAVYKLLTGAVVPRPIGWVSTVDAKGQPNLAPFSFFNAVCSRPPTLLFCPSVRSTDANPKDTLNNLRQTGEFVVNIVTQELAEAMNKTATELPAEVDEFSYAGLSAAPSLVVAPPRVAESPVHFECRLNQIIQIGDGGLGAGWIVIGEIVHLHVDERVLLPNYKIDTAALQPIGRLAGPHYACINETFELFREPSQVQPR